jgi:hypothetical protein
MANIYHPPTVINEYLAEKVNQLFNDQTTLRFFPSLPTDLDALTSSFPDGGGKFAVYDRMFRLSRKQFPHIKCEQVLYYFYSQDYAVLTDIVGMVQQVLDRGDDSAQDINAWYLKNKENLDAKTKPIYFHNFKVYHLQETRDIIDFGTARTYAANKIIIDYDWHQGRLPEEDFDLPE